jgi:lysophospholipase L1-like esterase
MPFAKLISVKFLLNLTIAVVGVAAALTLLEIAARFLPTPYRGDSNPADTAWLHTGWRGQPLYQTTVDTEGYFHTLALNSLGMHDTEHPFAKPANTTRILILGDSFVQAVQVDQAQTVHQVLEDALNRRADGKQVEVISAGVGGWGTGQQLQYYRHEGRNFRPDLVLLLLFLGNDVKDNLPGRGVTVAGINHYAPYFVLGDDALDPQPWLFVPGLPPAMGQVSRPRKWLNNGLGQAYRASRLLAQLEPLVAAEPPQPSMLDFYLGNSHTFDYAYQLTLALVQQFHREVSQDGADFAVVIISPLALYEFTHMSEPEREAAYQKFPGLRRAEEIAPPNQQIADHLARHGIPALDLFPAFLQEMEENNADLHFSGDKHWNAAGNRLAGHTIAEWLQPQLP